MDALHRRAYHRYFEGYTEIKEIADKGKMTIRRVYTGYYYRQDISDRRWKLHRLIYLLYYVFSAAVLLWCGTVDVYCNVTWYASLAAMAGLFSMIWLAKPVLMFAFSKRELLAREYRSISSIKNIAIACGICYLLCACAFAVCLILNRTEQLAVPLLCIGLYLLSAIGMFRIYQMEKKVEYARRKSDAQIDEKDLDNSFEIRQ